MFINKPQNVLTGLKSLKLDLDKLDVGKLKSFLLILKKECVVENDMVKKVLSKVTEIENKVPSIGTPIHESQHDTDKQNLQQNPKMIINKTKC